MISTFRQRLNYYLFLEARLEKFSTYSSYTASFTATHFLKQNTFIRVNPYFLPATFSKAERSCCCSEHLFKADYMEATATASAVLCFRLLSLQPPLPFRFVLSPSLSLTHAHTHRYVHILSISYSLSVQLRLSLTLSISISY